MDLSKLMAAIRTLSDEQGEASENLVNFLNDAIAKINIECGTVYPFFSLNASTYIHPIPESWQRALFIPFGVGRVKQKESSQFEYTDAYGEFRANLEEFKNKYNTPDQYKDANTSTSVIPNFNGHWYSWE